jgi:hypothetical protein
MPDVMHLVRINPSPARVYEAVTAAEGFAGGGRATPSSSPRSVNEYLVAFNSGYIAKAQPVVADAYSFTARFYSARLERRSAKALRYCLRSFAATACCTNGRTAMNLQTTAGKGAALMAEWYTVGPGRLVPGRLIFDTAVLRKLVPAVPPVIR